MRTLVQKGNRLLEPDRQGLVMYGDGLPTRLIEQVTKIGNRAFLANRRGLSSLEHKNVSPLVIC
jgi:hypothetical protein